jgi:hypothetical protein
MGFAGVVLVAMCSHFKGDARMSILAVAKLNAAIGRYGKAVQGITKDGHKLLVSAAYHAVASGNTDPLNDLLKVAGYQAKSMAKWVAINKLASLVPENKETKAAAHYKPHTETRKLWVDENNKPRDAAKLEAHIEGLTAYYVIDKPQSAFKGADFNKDLRNLIKRYEALAADEAKREKVKFGGFKDLSTWATANVLAN